MLSNISFKLKVYKSLFLSRNMTKDYSINELKEEYNKIQKAHDLPVFEEMNHDFQIEKIDETENLLREVRKFMADKFSNYMRFSEALLNPTNVPMFVFAVVKTLQTEDKKVLSEIYKKLAGIEIQTIELDIKFDEKKEAGYIKENFKIWQGIKENLLKIIEVVQKNWDSESVAKDKGYFG